MPPQRTTHPQAPHGAPRQDQCVFCLGGSHRVDRPWFVCIQCRLPEYYSRLLSRHMLLRLSSASARQALRIITVQINGTTLSRTISEILIPIMPT